MDTFEIILIVIIAFTMLLAFVALRRSQGLSPDNTTDDPENRWSK